MDLSFLQIARNAANKAGIEKLATVDFILQAFASVAFFSLMVHCVYIIHFSVDGPLS